MPCVHARLQALLGGLTDKDTKMGTPVWPPRQGAAMNAGGAALLTLRHLRREEVAWENFMVAPPTRRGRSGRKAGPCPCASHASLPHRPWRLRLCVAFLNCIELDILQHPAFKVCESSGPSVAGLPPVAACALAKAKYLRFTIPPGTMHVVDCSNQGIVSTQAFLSIALRRTRLVSSALQAGSVVRQRRHS